MKDWEISRSYVLPRILYGRGRNDLSSSKLYKPNLRFFSLREECNDWKTWKRSDYFYPEIIPEPDYSDSGDEADESQVDSVLCYVADHRSAIERLRELTEVDVSSVDLKKAPSEKVAAGSQARPKPKAGPQKTKEVSKESGRSYTKSPSNPQQTRRSPSPPSKTAPKVVSKIASKTQQARRSPSPPSKSAPKSPPKVSKRKSDSSPSQTDKSAKFSPRPKSPPTVEASPSKQVSKSPPTTPKPKRVGAAKGKTSPEADRNSAAISKEPGVSKLASPSGDSKDVVFNTPPSSPIRGKSPFRSDHSSDDEQLIKPKKPYSQQSTERMKLHQELKFSQRYGKPGPSKTELQLALERYTENKMKRELVAEEKTSLEKILELQAKKIEMQETEDVCPASVERLQKPPIVEADPQTEEFFRVHARVVSSNSLTRCFLSKDEKCILSDTGSDS